jgi:hypothetical protein
MGAAPPPSYMLQTRKNLDKLFYFDLATLDHTPPLYVFASAGINSHPYL